ncbi:MAG: DMT family transporter [Candidatus Heimdallarchaeota archaeon]|nr:MAG: DMT family transporter [Candidatus Heimdallarchaeota archaeon]
MENEESIAKSKEKGYEIGAYLLLLATAVIWAFTWPLGRWLVSPEVGGETIPPMIIASLRYLLVIPCFFLILKIKEKNLNISFMKSHWKIFAFMGITSVTVYQAGYLIGEYYTSASDAVVIVSSHPMLVLIFASIVLKMEKLNGMRIFGTLLSFTGILLIFGFSPNVDVPNRILGDILIFLGAIFYAQYIVVSRYFLNKCEKESFQPSSLYIITWVSFFGLLSTIPVSLIISPEYINPILYFQVPERVWFGVAYLAFVSTVLGYWFYLEGVKRLSASRAAIFQNLVPIFGVGLSVILLNEIFDPLIHISSILLIITGITLVNRGK